MGQRRAGVRDMKANRLTIATSTPTRKYVDLNEAISAVCASLHRLWSVMDSGFWSVWVSEKG